jgi:Leucine-rich repeat (LRR) protein
MDIAKMLFSNKVLRSLQLEGNNLGPKSAKEFGIALRVNNTLRLLDLESNQLTQDGEDLAGIVQFINALQHNKSLTSLNLANNKLEEPIDKEIRSMLEVNTTIIDFEFGFNMFRLPEV